MKQDDTITDALRNVRLFQGLDTAALRRIAAQTSPHSFPSGATVIDADTSGRFGRLYVIASGTAEALVNDAVVATFGPNDYFGEMSVLDGSPRSATVRPENGPSRAVLAKAATRLTGPRRSMRLAT